MEKLFGKLDDLIAEAIPLTREISEAARKADNETEFQHYVISALEKIVEKHGLKTDARQERLVLDTGRMDANFSHLILEFKFKKNGILEAASEGPETTKAVAQIERYLEAFHKEKAKHAAPPAKSQLFGIILDGYLIVFVRYVDHHGWIAEAPAEVNAVSIEKLLRILAASAYGKALTPDNLIRDFGAGSDHAKRFGALLHDLAQKDPKTLAGCIFNQWRTFFGETCSYEEGSAKLKRKKTLQKFCSDMGVTYKGVDVGKLIFGVHTYYAFLIKLIAYAVLVSKKTNGGNPLSMIPIMTTEELHKRLKDLEAGTGFTSYWGIRNFPEDPFFTWYLLVWNDDLAEAVRRLADALSTYDPTTFRQKPEAARDLLKNLYQYLIPGDIRHDLGEYYTPDWLAEHTLNRVGYEGRMKEKLLDPACGSGTFLVHAIRRKMEYCRNEERLSDETLLKAILETVKGIDLNPLAVTAARANYIFAIDELLAYYPHGREIPVYLADSIYPPKSSKDVSNPYIRTFHTVVGDFDFPIAVHSEQGMSYVAQFLHDHVEDGLSFESFIERLKRSRDFVDEDLFDSKGEVAVQNVDVFRRLFKQLNELKDQKRNSIWATIIKNAYMPLFLKNFGYIAGNPPWVNWESLPDKYRSETKHLWENAGLFVHKGMDAILGKGKKDLSTLMAFESIRRYLKDGGKLGFVITQSVFKTSGAAQGFRQFRFTTQDPLHPGEVPLCVESADDFTDFQPFEAATNRTAMIVLRRGIPMAYSMKHYTVWQKRPGKRVRSDSTLDEVIKATRRLPYHAKPVNAKDKTSPWITARPKALEALKNVLGKSDYQARAGVYSGGLNAVYWLKGVESAGEDPHTGKKLVRAVNLTEGQKSGIHQLYDPVLLEEELVYPLLRGRDVKRWQAEPSAHILMVQDPKTRRGIDEDIMQREYPRAWSYLKRFEKELRERAAFKRYFTRKDKKIGKVTETGPFYSMFNVGEYSFAKYKVAWREQASRTECCYIAGMKDFLPLPDHKSMLVACRSAREAHYLAAIINSTASNLAVLSYAIGVQFDTHLIQNVRIAQFQPKKVIHRKLAELSDKAHKLADEQEWQELAEVEDEIDLLVAKLYRIKPDELEEIKRNLREIKKEDLKTGKLFPR